MAIGFSPKTCESCGYDFGAGEISKRAWVTGRVRVSGTYRSGSGTSSSSSFGAGRARTSSGRRNSSSYTSGRTITEEQNLWICNECWAAEQARRGREFMLKAAGGIIVVLGIGGYLILSPSSPTPPATGAATALVAPGDDAAKASATEPAGLGEENQSGSPQASDQAEPQAETASQVVDVAPEAPTPSNSDALRRAIMVALDTGNAGRWRDERVSGGISVSVEQPTGSEICRSYRYTVDEGAGSDAPHDGTACKPLNGEWKLEG